MIARGPRSVILVIAATALLAGCASGADGMGQGTAPSAEAPAAEAPSADAPATPAADAAGAYLDYADGVIESTPGTKALFFHAPWCPQCRALDDDLRASGVPDGLTVFKVDYDSRTDLRQKYGVTLQTTVVFVDDAGEAISSQVLYDDPSVASLAAAIP